MTEKLAMEALVAALCAEECAGRAAGTPGGERARELVVEALRGAGADPQLQQVPGCGGANVIATLPGDVDRWVLVAAHYDHLGRAGRDVYHGADDNAAAVAILTALTARLCARPPAGRGVIIAAFDAEEPPHFMTPAMGSEHYARHPVVPLERTDLMICMDLVGHFLGGEEAPAEVRDSLFALGAERSAGTGAIVDGLARSEEGLVERIDAEVIPPMSDYQPFWARERPFPFLTNGRWRHYHTPEDTPEKLAYDKMVATARWLERCVRAACAGDDPIAFRAAPDDASTLRTAIALCEAVASPEAAMRREMARALLAACDREGRLPPHAGTRDHAGRLDRIAPGLTGASEPCYVPRRRVDPDGPPLRETTSMKRRMFLGKIHRARITHADLDYEGSVTIDRELLEAAGMIEHEEVHVWNVTRGTRVVTYTLAGPPGSGVVCINGAAAHHNGPGDVVILATFGEMDDQEARRWQPKVVFVDDHNRIRQIEAERPGPAMPRHLGEMPS